MKAHEINKKIEALEKMESKILRRIDSLQRNALNLRQIRQGLEKLRVPPTGTPEKNQEA